MIRIAVQTIVHLSALASLIGLYLGFFPADKPRPDWHWAGVAVLVLMVLAVLAYEVRAVLLERHKTFEDADEINAYMCRWISNRGRASILSRDLSWGSNPIAKQALLTKARQSELSLFISHETTLSAELAAAGADVIYYGNLNFEPRSRFTIIGFGRDGSRLAVGTERKGKHIVYEFGQGEHPITALSDDISRLLRLVALK